MAKFRCIRCNEPIELNQHRGFKAKDHRCPKCGGLIEVMYHCSLNGKMPERIKTTVNNNYVHAITDKPYYSAWRNKRHTPFIINSGGKFDELTFAEHNNFDFVQWVRLAKVFICLFQVTMNFQRSTNRALFICGVLSWGFGLSVRTCGTCLEH